GGVLFGTGDVRNDLAKGAGWVLNLAVAEWAIRGRHRPRTPATDGAAAREPFPATSLQEELS
ncbi:MAG: hypothetical protein JWO11_1940, partial [Nocardioides sp.]|nr:hypothetical protein [Nocardioides sp.]